MFLLRGGISSFDFFVEKGRVYFGVLCEILGGVRFIFFFVVYINFFLVVGVIDVYRR